MRNSEDPNTITTSQIAATTDNTTPGANNNSTNTNHGNSDNGNGTLVFVGRNEWNSLDVHGTSGMIEIPCKNVIIAHTETRECDTRVNTVIQFSLRP